MRKALHETILDEILEERVSSSRGRRNPRGVKQKMSNYPIRDQSSPCNKRLDVTEYIQVVGVPLKEHENSALELQIDPLAECSLESVCDSLVLI